MRFFLRNSLPVIITVIFLMSCSKAEIVQSSTPATKKNTPTVLPSSTVSPVMTVTSKPLVRPSPTTLAPAEATIEAFDALCIGSREIYSPEISPNGKWIAATCYSENGKEESPLQVSSIDHSKQWKIYYHDYIFSAYLNERGLELDRHDGVIPYHWSKDGRFLYAIVGSRLDGCCWIPGGRYVLLMRLNLETGEQIALLNSDYYSAYIFNFIFSDSDRYLLFTPPSNQPYDFAILDFQTWETQEVFLEVDGGIHLAYARLSPNEDKVIFPLFKFDPDSEFNEYYVDSIAVVDFVTRSQEILITGLVPENELFPIRWIDSGHVLLSNVNPVYYAGNQKERHWLLDINSGQFEEETP